MKCLVYNTDGRYLGPTTIYNGFLMVYLKRAYTIENHDHEIRTPSTSYPAPKKIVVRRYAPLPSDYFDPAPLNMNRLKARDEGLCQYCGKGSEELEFGERWTIDHVIPKSQGGKHEWENVVLCCSSCNNKKANQTPEQAGMELLGSPRVPYKWELDLKRLED